MTFISVAFFVLFVITYLILKVVKKHNQRLFILLFASYFFYAWWDIRFLLLMILEEFLCYFLAKKIERNRRSDISKWYLLLGVLIPTLAIFFFKYWGFVQDTLGDLFGLFQKERYSIVLPIGISFYTFQMISYVVDVYNGKIKACKSFVRFSLYVSFFPQLVAGPIVRANEFLPQLDQDKELTWENLGVGLQIFVFGAFKKIVIADRLAVCVDSVFAVPEAYSGAALLCAVFSYYIQIYCDFSGYSDMAIGIAKVLGYDLCVNFNVPYLASNPTEFWKRWHISLSKWLQDYIYIPLGGNRKGTIQRYKNLFLTMLIGGLWHGANWTFVIWGALHGLALIVHKIFVTYVPRITLSRQEMRVISKIGCIMCNNAFVMFCWIFFRAQSVSDAFCIINRIVQWADGIQYVYVWTIVWGLVLLIAHIWVARKNAFVGKYIILDLRKNRYLYLFFVVLWIILGFAYSGSNPFIYFQF